MRFIKNISLAVSSISLIGLFLLAPPALAGTDVFNDVCTKAPDSTVCRSKNPSGNPLFGPDGVLTLAISIVSIIVGLTAVIMLIVGGLKFITSGSSPQDVAKARETVIYAIVGLIIALLAQTIVQFFLKEIS